jgi:hypothetical protein
MRSAFWPAALVFLLTFPFFSHCVHLGDHQWHIAIAKDMAGRRALPPHPLFHACLLALTARDDGLTAPGVVAFLLAGALGVRAWITAAFLSEGRRVSGFWVAILCLALALAMPLPAWWGIKTYLGDLSPNRWHNPTGVFAMPFALAVFICGARTVSRPSWHGAAQTSVALCLSLLAKPNYVLAFGPCLVVGLGAATWRAIRQGQLTARSAVGVLLLTFAPAAVVLGAQFVLFASDSRILYAPFEVWRLFTRDHVTDSILVGIVYPLAVVICFPREANSSSTLTMAWAALGVGLATFALFAESGDRIAHGNFSWGMIFADQVLFVASTAFLLQQPNGWRRAFCFATLGAHAMAGVFQLAHDWAI